MCDVMYIDKVTISSDTRSLKAEYEIEPLKELCVLHGIPYIEVPYKKFPKRFSKLKRKFLRAKYMQEYIKKETEKGLKILSDKLSVDISREMDLYKADD
jgi:hypothetical protein